MLRFQELRVCSRVKFLEHRLGVSFVVMVVALADGPDVTDEHRSIEIESRSVWMIVLWKPCFVARLQLKVERIGRLLDHSKDSDVRSDACRGLLMTPYDDPPVFGGR